MRLPFALLVLVASLGATACPGFFQAVDTLETAQTAAARPNPPRVAVAQVRLEHAPTNAQLAGYYCSQVAPVPVCMLLAPVPSQDDLRFSFAVDLDITNDSTVAMPAVQILAAFTAFPDNAQAQQNLGAVCLSLCDDPNNCPQNDPSACQANSTDIRSLGDFAGRAVNFLVAVAEGQERFENLRVRTIAPNATTRATVRLRLDPNQVLSLVRTLSQDAIDQIRQGRQPQFAIPYKFEGTVWVDIEHFGRIAVPIPVYRNVWNLQS